MDYKLYLDDYRFPPGSDKMDWVIARSMEDAIWYITNLGLPYFISFDHDLGEEHYDLNFSDGKTGYDFAKWFCDYFQSKNYGLDLFPDYKVHSMNPAGAENIRKYLSNFIKHY